MAVTTLPGRAASLGGTAGLRPASLSQRRGTCEAAGRPAPRLGLAENRRAKHVAD